MIDRGIGRCCRGIAAALAAGLVLSLGLAGCDDDSGGPADSGLPSEDDVTGTASMSPSSPATTPTPTEPATPAPPIPESATKDGRAGAKAFVEFYIDLLTYARHTGDVAPLRRYSHPECGGCGDYIRFYRKWYERGGWFKDGERTITSYDRVVPTVPPNDMYVRINGIHNAGDYREQPNSPVKRARQEKYTFEFWLVRDARGWRASGLDNL